MNILTIIIIAIFALSVFGGYKKGFLQTVFSLVSWIIVLVLCDYVTPIVTTALVTFTDIEVKMQMAVEFGLGQMIAEAVETSGLAELEAALPAGIKTMLLGEGMTLQEVIANDLPLDTALLTQGIIETFAFVITVACLRVGMMVVETGLGFMSKLPLIGPMDKMLGMACGAGSGLIWCWVILAVVSVLAFTGTNTELATYISQSQLLTWLQDNNVILNLILGTK